MLISNVYAINIKISYELDNKTSYQNQIRHVI